MTVSTIGLNSTNDIFTNTPDTSIFAALATTNWSTDGTMYVGQANISSGESIGIIKFDGISSLPASITVSALSITLTNVASGGANLTLLFRRLLRNWVANQVTWNIYSTSNNWTTAGALSDGNDRVATPTVSVVSPSATGVDTLDITALAADVEGWAAGTFSNYGWAIRHTSGGSGANGRGYVQENGADLSRPYLTVTYTVPTGIVRQMMQHH